MRIFDKLRRMLRTPTDFLICCLGLTMSVVVSAATRRLPPLPQEKMKYLYSPKTFIVFDWDDNVFKLPTWNAVFVKGEVAPLLQRRTFLITSSELALFKREFGQPGTPLERFELIGDDVDPMNGSYRFARPGKDGRNYVLEDMNRAIAPDGAMLDRIPDARKAPFFELYIAREAKPETRNANRILTARGHTVSEFHGALSRLAEAPDIAAAGYRPTDPERMTLVGGAGPVHDLKAADLAQRLREAEKNGYRLFVFPDDDPMNIRRAAEALANVEHRIPVWLIWTREHGQSRIVDLSRLTASTHQGVSLNSIVDEALTVTAEVSPRAAADDAALKAAMICRSLFF